MKKKKTHQETSREAWRAFVPCTAELDTAIMEALQANAPCTCQFIEGVIERDHQSVSANLRHLAEKGLVEASGEHGLTRSGRRAIKWRIAIGDAMKAAA